MAKQREFRTCRVCGCTDFDCSQCIEKTGFPCAWAEEDLCTACLPKSKKYSFIDFGLKDFLRNENGEVVVFECEDVEQAAEWLISVGQSHTEWTNEGTRYWCWDDEEN